MPSHGAMRIPHPGCFTKRGLCMTKFMTTLALFAFACCAAAQPNATQGYPTKPIRFVVPYPPGGFTDILARLIGQKLTDSWSQSVVIENKGGGGSTIGTDIVAKAPADGYTILMVAPDIAINPSLYRKLP